MWADELKRVLNRLRQETYNPNSMKLKCPNCEALYESGKFCIECGTRLQEIEPVFVCSSCGYRTKRGKYCPECGTKLVEQNSLVGTASADKLPMDKIREAAEASYPKQSLKALAVAALKIAEVIQERVPNADVSYMVHPSVFDPRVPLSALPVHFLFKKNGVPKVAVVAVTSNGFNTLRVLATANACKANGIGYVRVYADGCYADWIEGRSAVTGGPVSRESVEFCKNWLVKKITQYL